jgi:hypothetical protein
VYECPCVFSEEIKSNVQKRKSKGGEAKKVKKKLEQK